MHIYPAIDIKQGACVRLYQGSFEQVTHYASDPIALAKSFAKEKPAALHVVDLDGAQQGVSINHDVIAAMVTATGLKIQTGGGIRSREQIEARLAKGIHRVVLGSMAILQQSIVKQWLQEFGAEHIALALDVRVEKNGEPRLLCHGWQTTSDKNLWELLDSYQSAALKHVICTDVSLDGTLQGPNINLYQACVQRYPNIFFQASGGVHALADLTTLAELSLSGVIVGKALYENKFSLRQALDEVAGC